MTSRNDNARTCWGYYYHLFRTGIFKDDNRHVMREYRREAALERKLGAAQRQNTAMAKALENDTELISKLFQRVGELERELESTQRNNQRVISDHDARLLEQWHERM